MNILILNGSSRSNGNTAALANAVCEQLGNAGASSGGVTAAKADSMIADNMYQMLDAI